MEFRIAPAACLSGLGIALAVLVLANPAAAKVEGDTIFIGAPMSETGKYAVAGKHAKNGAEFAIKRINEKGGVKIGDKTYKLKAVYYDDESTPARAAQLAERLINQDGVKFMLGPYATGLTQAVAAITEKHKIPMVEAQGASRSLFTQGYKYMFGVLSTSEQYLQSALDLAAAIAEKSGKGRKSVRVAVLVENDAFSLDIRDGVIELAKKHGMKVVVDDKMPRDFTDLTPTLAKVKALKPDIFLASGHDKGAALVVRQAKEQRVNVPMFATTQCESAKIDNKQQFGDAGEGVLCPAQWVAELKYSDPVFGSASDYSRDFKAAYGYDPPYQAAESSASFLVFKDAFERAKSFDTEKVRNALAATDLPTFYGRVKFDETGKNIAKPMVLRQIQNGVFKVVAPVEWATDKLVHPRKAQ